VTITGAADSRQRLFFIPPKPKSWITAKGNYIMVKLISKSALLIMIVAILYLLSSGNLLSLSPSVIAVQLLAVALSVWSRRSFQPDQFSIHAEPKKGQLLSRGPYQYIRHPMYAAALLLIWSGIWAHTSPVNLAIGVIVTGIVGVRIGIEEQHLRTRYPDYAEYSHRTKRIIPLII
jgi:protein-S-isoprenylcysteine O-methyltransferase Ste14